MNLRTFEKDTHQHLNYNDVCNIVIQLVKENESLKEQMNEIQKQVSYLIKKNRETEAHNKIKELTTTDDTVLNIQISFDEWAQNVYESVTIDDILFLENQKIEDILIMIIKKNISLNINKNPFYILKKNMNLKSTNSSNYQMFIIENPNEGFVEIRESKFENFIRLLVNTMTRKVQEWKKENDDIDLLEKYITISNKLVSLKYTKKNLINIMLYGFSNTL